MFKHRAIRVCHCPWPFTMKADLDFDIIAHFGNIKNVDLLSKGLYIVQTKLHYGVDGKLIVPVGMFSSPSTVCSTVQSQTVGFPFVVCMFIPVVLRIVLSARLQLPPVPITSMCEVHDPLHCFRTRSIVIRYRGERYVSLIYLTAYRLPPFILHTSTC
jgi:hypothetical protein